MSKDFVPESTGLTIGADPELVCLNKTNDAPVNIVDFLPRQGEFGADGHGYIAEIRPKFAVYPRDLNENIRNALLQGFPQFSPNEWVAGPYIKEKPLGGHIHIGTPLTDPITDALIHLMCPILAVVENREQACMRRTRAFIGSGGYMNNQGRPYGDMGDVKVKSYGFEWRTPSSFIMSPATSLAVITLTKAVVWEQVIGGPTSFNRLPRRTIKNFTFKADDFNNCKKSVFLPMLEELWKIFHRLHYFRKGIEGRQLWSSISYLKRCITMGGFKVGGDLKRPWKINSEAYQQFRKSLGANQIRKLPTRAVDIRAERLNRVRSTTLIGDWEVEDDGKIVPVRETPPRRALSPEEVFNW